MRPLLLVPQHGRVFLRIGDQQAEPANVVEQACQGRSNREPAKRPVPLKTVTMRLPVPDLKTAQDLAQDKGLPYQTYIKMLLHEALQRERRSA